MYEPAVLHEHALMLGVRRSGHVDDNVHQRGRLRDLPVESSSLWLLRGNAAKVDDEVPNRAEAKGKAC